MFRARAHERVSRAAARSAIAIGLVTAAGLAATGTAGATASGAATASRAGREAPAPAGTKAVSYLGERLFVPASWPVFQLTPRSTTCVRFDRAAVYLGATPMAPHCTGSALGLAGALQVQPLTTSGVAELRSVDRPASTSVNGQQALVAVSPVDHRVVAAFPSAGVEVTVSYVSSPATAQRIVSSATQLVGASSAAASRAPAAASPAAAGAPSLAAPRSAGRGANGSRIYSGLGFDTCDAPGTAQMATWMAHSPYSAIGVYIGGANAACTNISSSWVDTVVSGGWHLFPIYVGLQAPCVYQGALATMSANKQNAYAEGVNAAGNAVAAAGSFAMGTGNTIYYDMEGWNTASSSCNAAVLSYVRGWTNQLHADGYQSGVYSSAGQGLAVIQSLYGTNGSPDVAYFALWDGVPTTATSYLPPSSWPNHQRIKQYNGNLTETYGGVTLSVDQDYLDAPTVGAGSAPPPPPPPTVTRINPRGGPAGNRLMVIGSGFVQGGTTVSFGGTPATRVRVLSPMRLVAVVPAHSASSVQVTVSTSAGTSRRGRASRFTFTPFSTIAGDSATGGYWYASEKGNVLNFGVPFDGSPYGERLTSRAVGIAATSTGYLVTTAAGNVYAYGTAWLGSPLGYHPPAPVVGIAATPTGYVVATAAGNVYNFHTPWYGSPYHLHSSSPIVGIAAEGSGYVLTTAAGNVYAYGTTWYGSPLGLRPPAPVIGIAATRTGYVVATSAGNVYAYNTTWWGSEVSVNLPSRIVGITGVGGGYVLASADGQGYAFDTAWKGSPAQG